ncbi:MAG: hypothetical protein O7D27_03775, partial [Alphaproteobacteria bacterium]|nr:hypothetical protein [Alphaproteobacteria bacterium]
RVLGRLQSLQRGEGDDGVELFMELELLGERAYQLGIVVNQQDALSSHIFRLKVITRHAPGLAQWLNPGTARIAPKS